MSETVVTTTATSAAVPALVLSTALRLVLEDLRELEPDRYDYLDEIAVYREWVNDGTTVAEIDEAERGRQLDAQLATAYRLVLTTGYGLVVTVLLDTREHAGHLARLVVAS